MNSTPTATLSSPPASPSPGGDGVDTAAFRRQMDEVVARIPMHAIRSVLDAVEGAASPNAERARHLRDALVDHFNRLRPMKARRLFTSLFEPFLVDDPILYRSPESVPALVQRVDMGGIWAALARHAFPGLAAEVQSRLDTMAREAMLDAVLASPDAMVMRELMRKEALDFLYAMAGDRKLTDRFLALANDEALHDARLRTQYLGRKAPIDGDLLGFVRALLEHNAVLVPLTERMRRDIEELRMGEMQGASDPRSAEVDCQSALMVGFVRRVRDLGLPFRDQSQLLAWFAPLYGLNVKRRYDVFLRHVREHGGPAVRESHPLLRALLCHFHAACTTIREVVDGMFGDMDIQDGGVLSAPVPTRALLHEAVERFDRALTALAGTGFLASRSTGPALRAELAAVSRELTGTVMPALAARLQAAMNARHAPVPDHEDIVWLLELVWRWGRYLGAAGYANPELKSLRLYAVETGRLAFLHAMKAEPQEKPAHRMAHMLRIRRLMVAMGETVDGWISPVSQGLHRVVHSYLEADGEIAADEWAVIDAFVASVRRELSRSRNWQSADFVDILRLHEGRRRAEA
ncbi:hypothetical protein J2848_003771 [Azospirillum lipoferum]|uniref:Uncharacterized protein n=1 Tax=Azospirillum lipoferum TaxID=193 RepID=A0A5A9GC63_AZOLI|nr:MULTISPECIES: hypothetical protein [Azospirillum]KAA0592033.1 hypothetical protein FZ942_29510 [Azospirillum lipoferum]MCP1612091.1 hypothetical protein [Azospirillum lipoferum]MDW5536682.1 hypothetical protein [Azospirillum sp. NL1]